MLPVRAVILWIEARTPVKQEIRMCHLSKEQEVAKVVLEKDPQILFDLNKDKNMCIWPCT